MNSNFTFLNQYWNEIYKDALEAEKFAITAPRTSVFYSRRSMELIVQWLYENDRDLQTPYDTHLSALMFEPSFRKLLPKNLFYLINYIRKLGNLAVHSQKQIGTTESRTALRNLFLFSEWFADTYSKEQLQIYEFDDGLIPRQGDSDKNAQELKSLQDKLEAKDKELEEQRKKAEEYQLQLVAIQEEVHETKKENLQKLPKRDYSESETRGLFIDLLLKEVGWDPKGKDVEEYEVQGMPNDEGVGYVDYVLWGDDGKPLGLVEAKRTTVDPQQGQRQAELYAICLEQMHGQRPIIFYSNGYDHWIWDDQMYPPRPVQGFYSKDQLLTLINRRKMRTDITKAEVNKDIAGRHYQQLAIKSVTEALNDKQRKTLLVMATGTGKTRVSIALVELLMKNNWIKNVLFLADRTALVNQAKNAFNEHARQLTTVDITKDKEDTTSRVVFSTYPTMMNIIDETNSSGLKRFGVGHFDLIIIDEAHRSVYQKYRAIFEYFDSLLVGLTATPKADIDRNTYELFELEENVPTYAYELDEAVKDGWLVPFRQISVPTKFLSEGLTYDELSEEEKEQYEMTFEDEDNGQMPMFIPPASFNDWLFNKSTVDLVLSHLMENGIKVEGGDKLGKTIIFAKNHKHALFIQERFNKNYPSLAGKSLRVIDNYVKYAQSLIDEFSDTKPDAPNIAVSVDMLDTGIDIPELVNLVFFKIVRSKAKFWQMIGRGTRLCEDLIEPGQDKQEFLVFDYCGNFEFFNVNPEGVTNNITKSLSQEIFERRVELAQMLQAAQYQQNDKTKKLWTQILDTLHEDVTKMDPNSFMMRPHRRQIDEFLPRERWNNLSNNDVLDIKDHLAPFSNLFIDDDELSRRFDAIVLSVQKGLIKPSNRQETQIKRIKSIAKKLEEKANIPAIAKHIDLIKKVQEDSFWANIDLTQLESIRRDLRDLVKLLDPLDRKIVYTNFVDMLGEATSTNGVSPTSNLQNYRSKIQRIIEENKNNEVIKKIYFNIPLNPEDVDELENLILSRSDGMTATTLGELFEEEPIGVFIRRIVGMDRESAKKAFADFISKRQLNSAQLQFIDAIVNHITQVGIIDPRNLYEQPFSEIHFAGMEGLFEDADIDQIFGVISSIKKNAQFSFVHQ